MKRSAIVMLLGVVLLAGCGDSGNEYVGKWIKLTRFTNDKSTLDIERNGDSFIIRDTHPKLNGIAITNENVETENIPATFKDGMLQVQTGLGAMSLVIDKTTGNLLMGHTQYKRAN